MARLSDNVELVSSVTKYIGTSSLKAEEQITELIDTADAYICGAVSPDYNRDDPRARLLIKSLCYDWYTDRGTQISTSKQNSVKHLIASLILQLKCEVI